jgi:hypothetical protein
LLAKIDKLPASPSPKVETDISAALVTDKLLVIISTLPPFPFPCTSLRIELTTPSSAENPSIIILLVSILTFPAFPRPEVEVSINPPSIIEREGVDILIFPPFPIEPSKLSTVEVI